jgi:splicing factor 3A subunit 3
MRTSPKGKERNTKGAMEQQRSSLEELHTIEDAITQRIRRNPEVLQLSSSKKKRPHREVLLQQHEIKRFLETYKQRLKFERSKNDRMTLDQFGVNLRVIMKDETNSMVKPLYETYKMRSSKVNILSEHAMDINLTQMFSSEERLGQFLDLVQSHELWLQISKDKLNYVQYLKIFDKFDQQDLSHGREYFEYLTLLVDYLKGFIKRSRPLFDLDSLIEGISKEYLQDNLYCSACEKTFAKQTVYEAHLSGKKHLKNSQNLQNSQDRSKSSSDFKSLEHQVYKLTEFLSKVRDVTIHNVERRKALSERERLIEIDQLSREEQDLSDSSSSSEEEPQQVSAFANMPLGADGFPIPYWLYKLHGLKKEYPCEVCQFKYKGRKAYDKHFTEVRHSQALKLLGIEPNEVFKDISSIDEVKQLWSDLQKQKRMEEANKDQAVEVEDDEGNVMSEKVYNDLKKQGLI